MSKHIKNYNDTTVMLDDPANVVEDLKLINDIKGIGKELTADDVVLFPLVLCDNDIDDDHEKMSDNLLGQIAEKAPGLTIIKNHDWDAKNQIARIYKSVVIESADKVTKVGDRLKYILARAYTLKSKWDIVEDIQGGILREGSINFECKSDVCSICGTQLTEGHYKGQMNLACGHTVGQVYDGQLCYVITDDLYRLYEYSFVVVPCQEGAGIANKLKEGTGIMKKRKFIMERLFKSKAMQEADEKTKEAIKAAIESEDADLSEEDIEKLVSDNAALTEENASLKAKIKELEGADETKSIDTAVDTALDGLKPKYAIVKDNMLKEIDKSKLKRKEDGSIDGLDAYLTELKEKYKELLKPEQAEETEEEKAKKKAAEDAAKQAEEDAKKAEAEAARQAEEKAKSKAKLNPTVGDTGAKPTIEDTRIKSKGRSIRVY